METMKTRKEKKTREDKKSILKISPKEPFIKIFRPGRISIIDLFPHFYTFSLIHVLANRIKKPRELTK